jgi:hypothetical protein
MVDLKASADFGAFAFGADFFEAPRATFGGTDVVVVSVVGSGIFSYPSLWDRPGSVGRSLI